MATIDISNLRHVYANGHVGLDDINFTANDGEFIALLGPSGSGKTTLLRCIAGFLHPQEGNLRIDAQTVVGGGAWIPPEKRRLGMVFQTHAIWPHWTVARNVGYPLKRARIPRGEVADRVQTVLEQVGLAGMENRGPSLMSGGQRQRVALARAIVSSPAALLLDEALSSLDEPLRARLRLELKALTRDKGLTAIHVTHDRTEALALADRVVVLNDGRVEQIGTPAELLTAPATAFVAAFVSDATLFEAQLCDRGLIVDGMDYTVPKANLRTAEPLPAGGRSVAAVMPRDVQLERLAASSNRGAVVTSSLYGLHGFDVSVDWHGTALRAHVSTWTPAVGDVVEPSIQRAHVFAAPHQPAGAPESSEMAVRL